MPSPKAATARPETTPPAALSADRRSIAVLPFTSLSADPDHSHFAEGLVEELVGRLAMLRGLTVLAAPTRFGFRTQAVRVDVAGAVPGTTYLVDGSVRRSGDRVRISVRLIEAASEQVLFSRRYDRPWRDVLEIQDDIASNVIQEAQLTLVEGEKMLAKGAQTTSVEAWELFHRGVLQQLLYTAAGNRAAQRLYQQAIDCDPDYVVAKVGLGWTCWFGARSSLVSDPEAARQRCRAIVDGLLATTPDVPDVYFLDAVLCLVERRFDAALRKADAAYATLEQPRLYGRGAVGIIYLYSGALERARDIFLEELSVTPITPDDALLYYAHCLSLLGDHQTAVDLAQDYRRNVPGTVYGYTLLACAQGRAGDTEAARSTIALMREKHPDFNLRIFRHHEPYRDAALLDGLTGLLRDAGVPD